VLEVFWSAVARWTQWRFPVVSVVLLVGIPQCMRKFGNADAVGAWMFIDGFVKGVPVD